MVEEVVQTVQGFWALSAGELGYVNFDSVPRSVWAFEDVEQLLVLVLASVVLPELGDLVERAATVEAHVLVGAPSERHHGGVFYDNTELSDRVFFCSLLCGGYSRIFWKE